MKIFPEDIELVIKLQKGDVEAFDLVYAKYAGKLYGFAFKYLKSAVETEELVQSVFLKVWENHKILRKDSSFKSVATIRIVWTCIYSVTEVNLIFYFSMFPEPDRLIYTELGDNFKHRLTNH